MNRFIAARWKTCAVKAVPSSKRCTSFVLIQMVPLHVEQRRESRSVVLARAVDFVRCTTSSTPGSPPMSQAAPKAYL